MTGKNRVKAAVEAKYWVHCMNSHSIFYRNIKTSAKQ